MEMAILVILHISSNSSQNEKGNIVIFDDVTFFIYYLLFFLPIGTENYANRDGELWQYFAIILRPYWQLADTEPAPT